MDASAGPRVTEVGPRDAWKILSQDPAAVLVDVRTRPEWGFVGGPDITELGREVVRVEWQTWPGMDANPDFDGALLDRGTALPSCYLFICRSGARSMQAAQATARTLSARGNPVGCINVAEGFEGDLDGDGRRGGLNGWKARGLAWRQS